MFYGDHAVVTDGAGKVPVAEESGNPIARAFRDNNAIIRQNHGLLTASRHSIDDTVWTFVALNHRCHRPLLTEGAPNRPLTIDPEHAEYAHRHLGNSFISWLHFQTMYFEIVEQEPDFLD